MKLRSGVLRTVFLGEYYMALRSGVLRTLSLGSTTWHSEVGYPEPYPWGALHDTQKWGTQNHILGGALN